MKPEFTVIIVTHNRADVLRATLASVARLEYPRGWETIVVDNNSNDVTAGVVEQARQFFPVPLRYVFEGRPGKYWALNAGIKMARGRLIAATDDDAFPARDWLDRAYEGFGEFGCDFVGGRVFPVWGAEPPPWIDARTAITGKVLGLQDHGSEPRPYGERGFGWPLGVNVAYRRDAFDRVGLFDGRLGRVAGTLRNQSQREWHLRARDAGLRGMYLPSMVVHHCVEAERLTRRYFYRWFYWHGISRAIMYRTRGSHLLEPEGAATHAHERHLLGVPASVWRAMVRAVLSAGKRRMLRQPADAMQYELTLCFCAGVVRQRLRDRGARVDSVEAQALDTAVSWSDPLPRHGEQQPLVLSEGRRR
jgi:glucosyl-dolichyl phosphate glucuronosyltransferase